MKTKTKLKWRLASRPTPSEVQELLIGGIITKEEAREILFSEETEEGERTKKDLETEIEFLRVLVEKLSNRTQIVESIRYIQNPYINYPWYRPYATWCGTTAGGTMSGNTLLAQSSQANQFVGGALNMNAVNGGSGSFTKIHTF